jgi:hypothetical protein
MPLLRDVRLRLRSITGCCLGHHISTLGQSPSPLAPQQCKTSTCVTPEPGPIRPLVINTVTEPRDEDCQRKLTCPAEPESDASCTPTSLTVYSSAFPVPQTEAESATSARSDCQPPCRPALQRLGSSLDTSNPRDAAHAPQAVPSSLLVACVPLPLMRSQVSHLELLGRGGQAVVLRGVWQMADVAVKLAVANPNSTPASTMSKLLLEGPLSKRLRAPNVVETYCYSCTRLTTEALSQCQAADESVAGLGQGMDGCNWILDYVNEQPLQQHQHDQQQQQQLVQHSQRQQQHLAHLQQQHLHEQQQQGPQGQQQQQTFQQQQRQMGLRLGTDPVAPKDGAPGAGARCGALPPRQSFDSLDGFDSPSARRSAAAIMTYSDALSHAGAAPGCYLTQIIME